MIRNSTFALKKNTAIYLGVNQHIITQGDGSSVQF